MSAQFSRMLWHLARGDFSFSPTTSRLFQYRYVTVAPTSEQLAAWDSAADVTTFLPAADPVFVSVNRVQASLSPRTYEVVMERYNDEQFFEGAIVPGAILYWGGTSAENSWLVSYMTPNTPGLVASVQNGSLVSEIVASINFSTQVP